MGSLNVRVTHWDSSGVPLRATICRRGRSARGSRRDEAVGYAYLTAEEDGYVDEYAVVLEGRQIGTVEVGIHHSTHGGIFPDINDIAEDRRACEVVHAAVSPAKEI